MTELSQSLRSTDLIYEFHFQSHLIQIVFIQILLYCTYTILIDRNNETQNNTLIYALFSDLAVVTNNEIELLTRNGTLVGTAVQEFSRLKALAFDPVRHQFLVSDMDQQNDTIFTVRLSKETEIYPVVEDLPDDVQVMAAAEEISRAKVWSLHWNWDLIEEF